VGIQPQHNAAASYFMLDARGKVDAAATARLGKCFPAAATGNYPAVTRLASNRGTVVGNLCLLTGSHVLPVAEVFGPMWHQLASTAAPPERTPPEIIAAFHASPEFKQIALEPPSPSVDTQPLPHSPWELALVTRSHTNPALAPLQRVFVVARGTAQIHPALTEALEKELRREHAPVCGAGSFVNLSPTDFGVRIGTEPGEWGEGCSSLIRWDAKAKQLFVESRDVNGLLEAHRLSARSKTLAEARRLAARGKWQSTLEKLRPLAGTLNDDPESAELCRLLALAFDKSSLRQEARAQLGQCISLTTNRAEALLMLARREREDGDRLGALFHYEQALDAPLGASDRESTRRTIAELELELADAAATAGKKEVARLHYQRVLEGPADVERHRRARNALRSLR
jgi:hypothetical protein